MLGAQWSLRKKLLLGLAALVLLPIVTVAPFLFWQLHQASDSLHTFGAALVTRDYQRAYKLTDPELQKFSSYEAFLKSHEGLTIRFGNLTSLSWSSLSVKKQANFWYATVEVQLEF